MNDFIPQLVSLAKRLQECPLPATAGLVISGNEILDIDFGILTLVEDVLITELIPSIIVQTKVVSSSSGYVENEIKCYKLKDLSQEDLIQIKAVVAASKVFKWSVPHWLSINQFAHLLDTGEWLPDWSVPVQPTR